MTQSPKIIKAMILPAQYTQEMHVQYDNGTCTKIFEWYDDELHFTEEELVGLTAEEALDLRHQRDVAYIQSGCNRGITGKWY